MLCNTLILPNVSYCNIVWESLLCIKISYSNDNLTHSMRSHSCFYVLGTENINNCVARWQIYSRLIFSPLSILSFILFILFSHFPATYLFASPSLPFSFLFSGTSLDLLLVSFLLLIILTSPVQTY